MASFLSWLCLGSDDHPSPHDEANAPLIAPDPHDDTPLQAQLHQKLKTYLLLRALSKGYLPTTEQAVAHLRVLLSLDALNPRAVGLSPSTRKLVTDLRHFLQACIVLLRNKNGDDQLQELVWAVTHARAAVDARGVVTGAVQASARGVGTVEAGVDAVKTVGGLLMMNAEFRKLVGDLGVLARLVFADAAEAGLGSVEKVAEVVRPSEEELKGVKATEPAKELERNGAGAQGEGVGEEVVEVVGEGVMSMAQTAAETVREEIKEDGKGEALLDRLRRAVLQLRGKPDYAESVNVISLLMRRYARVYSRGVMQAAETVEEAVETNAELDKVVDRLWKVVRCFGREETWDELKRTWEGLVEHFKSDTEFEALMLELQESFNRLLTDTSFINADSLSHELDTLSGRISKLSNRPNIKDDLNAFVTAVQNSLDAIATDTDLQSLTTTARALITNVWPATTEINPDILTDATQVLFPLLLSAIQHIPILRTTLSTPEIDLLLENLILQPGHTVNASSFFPHRLSLTSVNTYTLSKAPSRYTGRAASTVHAALHGLTFRADNVGYHLKAHTGLWRFWDEGLVSIIADGLGLDIAASFELSRARLEDIVTLTDVDVTVHHLDFEVTRSRYYWLMRPFLPVLRPILRRVVKERLERAIENAAHALNRELVYARERLRATRVAQPESLWRFVRAVAARWSGGGLPEDVEVTVGVRSTEEESPALRDVYAPGSLVKLWIEEGEPVAEIVDLESEGAWRNKAFDL